MLSDKTEHHDLGINKATGYTVPQLLHMPSGWLATLPVCCIRLMCHDSSQMVKPSLV